MTCDVKRCKAQMELIYYNKEVCDKHWQLHCQRKINLKQLFKINDTGQMTLK